MRILAFAAALAALISTVPASAATLIGDTMEVSYRFPTVDDIYGAATPSVSPFVVGPGVETVVDVEGVTDITVDFDANSLIITFNTVLGTPTWASSPFNGLLFEGEGAAKISGATVVSTTMPGFDDSRFYLDGGDFGLNWQGLSYVDGTQIVIQLALVPEPATWAMMIGGMGAVGGAMRRRAKVSVRYA